MRSVLVRPLLLLVAAPWFTGCGGPSALVRWDPAHATPGLELSLAELRREPVGGKTDIAFRLTAKGVAAGRKLRVWHRPRGGEPMLIPGVYLSDAGLLMSSQAGAETELHAYGLARGEAYDLSARTTDGELQAYVKRIPFPLEARGRGQRRIAAELGSVRADTWVVTGEGFSPGEELNATLQSGDDVHLDVITIGPEGTFSRVLFPATRFHRESGTAAYKVTTVASGVLTLTFRWGPAALTPE